MAGLYSSLASGIESGFSMGRQAALDEETKRARKVLEERQAAEDVRRAESHELDAQRTRFGLERATEAAGWARDAHHAAALEGEAAEIEKTQAARQAQGLPVDEGSAQRYAEIKSGLATVRQRALDYFSRAKVGQLDPMSAPGPEMRLNLTAATGVLPEELPIVRQGVADVEAGMETGNWGLVTQGVNKAMMGHLKRGVGTASPYGGTITRKEIIGLDPAIDAAGNEHPNRFIPRLRVYVEGVSPTGGEMYYDAPMTQNGSTEADDKVVAIDVRKGMDWLANIKMLAEMASRPDMQERLKPGGPNDEAKRYIEQLRTLTAPQKKVVNLGGGRALVQQGDTITPLEGVGPEKAPTTRTFNEGGKQVTKQWDPVKKDWVVVGEAPRWKGGAGGAAAPAGGASPALGGAAAPAKPDDAVEFWARAVIAGDKDWQIGLARSKSGSTLIEAVKRRVPVLAKELGLEAQDIGTARAQSAALAATLKDLTKRSEAIDLFSAKVLKDMQTYDQVLSQVGSDSPLLVQKPINFLRRQFSSPELAQLDLAAKQVGTEYERLLTGGTLSVAQLHVGAQEDAKKLINGDMTPQQARATMEIMRREIDNARAAAHESTRRVSDQMRNLGRGTGPAAGAAAAPAAPGAAPAGGTGLPARPAGVSPTAKYSPSRNEWWDGGRKVWPAQ